MSNKKKAQSSSKQTSSSSPKQTPKQVLQSFGAKIGAKEIKKYTDIFGADSTDKVKSFVKRKPDVTFTPGGKKTVKKKGSASPGPGSFPGGGGDSSSDPLGGYYDKIIQGNLDLADLQGKYGIEAATIGANAQVSSAGIRADADKYLADAQVRGIDISSGRALEGTKYTADKESEWRQAVANIEVKGRLDLQPIINAGLEKVAGIEAQAQRDVAETTGKYNVEGIRVRGEADKQIGGMQLAGSMYNLINSAFG